MTKLLIIILSSLAMLCLIPVSSLMAVGSNTPAYTHLIYMFGHANIFHWLINMWCLVTLHHAITLPRIVAAYISSVLVSVLVRFLFPMLQPAAPVLGFSVALSFFIGWMALFLYRYNRLVFWQVLVFLAIGFFLPNMAAAYHLFGFLFGFLVSRIDSIIGSVRSIARNYKS